VAVAGLMGGRVALEMDITTRSSDGG
jgi:hypothetical protein